VLEDHSAFDRAAEVAKEFDDLAAIHEELEIARRQQLSLVPVEQTYRDYLITEDKLTKQRLLYNIVPVWFAMAGHRLWGQEIGRIEGQFEDVKARIADVQQEIGAKQSLADTQKEVYLQLGGNAIEQVQAQIDVQEQLTNERRRHAKDSGRLTSVL